MPNPPAAPFDQDNSENSIDPGEDIASGVDGPRHGEPKARTRSISWLAIVAGLVGYCAAFALLWHPILRDLWNGVPLNLTIKNYSLGDQLGYMGTTANVIEGRSAYVEPLTGTGSSIYPSGYYWLLGLFARLFHENTFFAWNVLGMFCTVALMVSIGWGARTLSGKRIAWIVGPVPILFGSLQWYLDRSFASTYGTHAVLWPPFAILFNPGAEILTLTASMCAFTCAFRAMRTESLSFKWLLPAGILSGLTLDMHTYVAFFTITSLCAALLLWHVTRFGTPRRLIAAGVIVALSWALILIANPSPTAHLAILVFGLAAPLFVIPGWIKNSYRALIPTFAAIGLFGAPQLVRVAIDIMSADSYLAFRSQAAYSENLSLPVGRLVLVSLPLVALIAVCLFVRGRNYASLSSRAWLVLLLGTLFSSVALIFNAAWGMNQEPYRFYPYAVIALLMLTMPMLLQLKSIALRALLAIGLCATLPATYVFATSPALDLTFKLTANENREWNAVAAEVPVNGLALVDTCISSRVFKAVTGANVVDYHLGIALPANFGTIDDIIDQRMQGRLASGAELSQAKVTNYITFSYCYGFEDSVLEQRFGKPLAVVPYADTAACGVPEGAYFSVWNTIGDRSTTGSALANYPKAGFFDSPPANAIPNHQYPCVSSAIITGVTS